MAKSLEKLLYLFLVCCLGMSLYSLYFKQSKSISTIAIHMRMAKRMASGVHSFPAYPKGVPHKGYYNTVNFVQKTTSWKYNKTVSVVLMLCSLFSLFVTILILIQLLQHFKLNPLAAFFFALVLNIVTVIYFPFFRNNYKGHGSPNVWHNSTFIVMKPFALLAFYFLVFGKNQIKESLHYIMGTAALILSIYTKPTFAVAFIPAYGSYIAYNFLVKREALNWKACIAMFLGLCFMAYQFYFGYAESPDVVSEKSMGFSFLTSWKFQSSNIPLSLLTGLSFPLSVLLLLNKKALKKPYLILGWLMIIISVAFVSSISEVLNGKISLANNFMGLYNISLALIFTFSLVELIKSTLNDKNSKFSIKICWLVFGVHFLSGLYLIWSVYFYNKAW